MSAVPQLNRLDDLRCPICQGSLEDKESSISCTGCGQRYQYDNGIPDLRVSRFDYYFNPIPKARMRALSEALSAETWSPSVREFLKLAPHPSWLDNIAVQGRYAWKLLMDLPPGGRVLDIGCGLGALISSIAPHVGTAYATDLTIERLIFANGRFGIFNGKEDVRTVASGDGPHLPFPDKSVDAVFLSGVLEWIGEGDTSSFSRGSKSDRLRSMLRAHFGDTNPRNIQLRFLREVLRILKPGGQLYVGIENRLSYEYFGRRRDHHSGLWFGSLMPRFMATLYSIAVARRPYRTYTYGLRGYQRLFAEAGFDSAEIFGFNDGYSDLKAITPAAAKVVRWDPAQATTRHERISRHPSLAPAFGILATKGRKQHSRLLDRLLKEVEEILGGSIRFSSFDVSENDKAILRGELDGRAIIVKLPMSETSCAHERANVEVLTRVRDSHPLLRDVVPEPLAAGSLQGQAYFVESRLLGSPPSGQDAAALGAIVRSVRNVLDKGKSAGGPRSFDDAFFDRYVRPRLAILAVVMTDADAGDADLIAGFFKEGLSGMTVETGVMHGDICFGHVLVQSGQLSGLVDWHAGDADGLPIVDAVGLAVSALLMESPTRTLHAVLEQLAGGQWKGTVAESALAGYLDSDGMTSGQRRAVVYLYWLHYVSNRVPFRMQYDAVGISTLLSPALEVFRSHLSHG